MFYFHHDHHKTHASPTHIMRASHTQITALLTSQHKGHIQARIELMVGQVQLSVSTKHVHNVMVILKDRVQTCFKKADLIKQPCK